MEKIEGFEQLTLERLRVSQGAAGVAGRALHHHSLLLKLLKLTPPKAEDKYLFDFFFSHSIKLEGFQKKYKLQNFPAAFLVQPLDFCSQVLFLTGVKA